MAVGILSMTSYGRVLAATTPMSQTLIRLDRLALSVTTGGRVCFKPSVTTQIQFVALTLPTNNATDYAPTAASMQGTGVDDASLPGTHAALPGMTSVTPTLVSKTLTYAITPFTPLTTTIYCFQFNAGLQTASNVTENIVGNVQTQGASNVPIDQGSYSVGLASPATIGDQISITGGVVPPTFQFNLTAPSTQFGSNFTLAPVSSVNNTLVIKTNAAQGYIIWAKGTNAGIGGASTFGALKSVTANYSLVGITAVGTGTSRSLSSGTQDYGLGVTSTAAGTVNANYNGTGANVGTIDPVNFQPIARNTIPTATDTLTIFERVATSVTTKAATDYADTIYLTGTGLF